MKRVMLAWSSGKDSAWALHVLRQQNDVQVVGLLTTMNGAADRVAMHAVRRELVERQADAAGLPLTLVELPWPCCNSDYERLMSTAVADARERGVTHMAFGDLFLEDVRDYRVRQLRGAGIEPMFPIWCGPDGTAALARQMIVAGLQAVLTCVDTEQLPGAFLGRSFDAALLDDLPAGVDPCGERGEFHTFCHAGPMFSSPASVSPGEQRLDERFHFVDLVVQLGKL